MRTESFNAVLNVLCEAELKIKLKALSRVKGLNGFSPLVRSLLLNAIPAVISRMTEAEEYKYGRVLEIERVKYEQLTGDKLEL